MFVKHTYNTNNFRGHIHQMRMTMPKVLSLCLLLLLWLSASAKAAENGTVAVNVGVIYSEDSELGKLGLKCIQMALSDFYNSYGHHKTRIVLHTRLYHPKDSAVGAASAAMYLLKYTQVKAIIGPTTSLDGEFVMHLGEKAQVPILSYSFTSPCVSTGRCPYFISVAQKDSAQVKAITAFIQEYQWRDVIPIYVDIDEYGGGLIPSLYNALQNISVRIPSLEPISSTATDDQLLQLLQKLKGMQTRVFVVHLSIELASRFFLHANELKMMGQGYVWIATTKIGNEFGSLDESVMESMEGVVGVQTYIPETNELKHLRNRWGREFQGIRRNVMGLWAYDAAFALARAVEQFGAPNSVFRMTKMPQNFNDLDSFGDSPTGPQLVEALHSTNSSGLSGNFNFAYGNLGSSSAYRIVNMLGIGSREVGFWTSEKGLVRKIYPGGKNDAGLRPIIWPGDATTTPKGWEIPASGNKLKVGVPVKAVYEQLVNFTQVNGKSDPPTGFCIDIFDTVMKNLGYSNRYEYIPYPINDGNRSGSYDDLVQRVFDQSYDVAVGDITIIANRLSKVDFTFPYTESGVTMVAPVRDDKKSAWVFLKPLTWQLWVTTLCSFIFIAFAIWVLEHRVNEEFRGPPLHKVGTSLFYSFSMMVFSQRENVLSNLTRCVVVVWVFVVLILTQSYTASLTTMLTVRQLKPTVTGVDELLSSRARVGFQGGTFVKGILLRMGFQKSNIVNYTTSQNLDDLLSNGTIAAVFDEIPYMRLFMAQFPSKYIMMQLIYETDGFGFAFQKGSPLATEVSKEILLVKEGGKMSKFESIWGMQEYNSSDLGNIATSASLGLDSFWGLFLIVGVISGLSLLIFSAQFLYESRDIWMDSDASFWSKIQRLAKSFEKRDMSAHAFRKRDTPSTQNVENDQTSIDGDGVDEITPTASNIPPRLSNYSDRNEENLSFSAGASPPRIHIDTISD